MIRELNENYMLTQYLHKFWEILWLDKSFINSKVQKFIIYSIPDLYLVDTHLQIRNSCS